MNYKLKLYVENEEGMPGWVDFFMDVRYIKGFYLPKLEAHEPLSVNIFVGGEFITVMQEAHIEKYLNDTFGDNLIKE